MQAFDPSRHRALEPIRTALQNWWANKPSDVRGIALYGSRAKNRATQYSDWDVLILTDNTEPDEKEICRALPRLCENAPIHALCESIDYVKSEAEYGGSLLSAIVEQGISLFGETVPFEEDTIKRPSYSYAETFFASILEALNGFLMEANIRYRKKKTHDRDATTHSAHAAEYLVKSFMSVRGINYFYVHDVSALCNQIEQEFPLDPLLKELRRLDGFTAKGHMGPYRLLHLPTESLALTTKRIVRILVLIPRLTTEICSQREVPKETRDIISDKLSVLQRGTNELEDITLKQQFQTALDKVLVFIK